MSRASHKHTWRVVGLDCPNCAKELEKAISIQSGIIDAEIDFMGGVVQIICNLESDCETVLNKLGSQHGVTFQEVSAKEPGKRFFWSNEANITFVSGVSIGCAWLLKIPSFFLFGMIVAGVPIAKKALNCLKSGTLEMNFLMLVAAFGAICINEYLEGATVLFLFSIAKWLEKMSTEKARASIDALKVQLPSVAHLVSKTGNEKELEVIVSKIVVGDIIRIKPGERLPLDGKVIEGNSSIDESALTGESVPVLKNMGAGVYAGTWNQDGTLLVEVTAISAESRLSRVMVSVEKAQAKKTKFQSSMERFAEIYTPVVVFMALLVAIVPPLFFGQPFAQWIYSSLVLLVISCPCALVLAAPVTLVSTMASAARSGILVRGGDNIEAATKIQVACFDKTGTLTIGNPEILEVLPTKRTDASFLSKIAISLEDASEHPLARAFKARAHSENIPHLPVSGFIATKGHGIEGTVEGIHYRFGDLEWALEICPNWKGDLPTFIGTCVTVSALCDNQGLLGLILLGDKIRPEAKQAIRSLKDQGISLTVLLSGDRQEAASEFGNALGINQSFGKLLPEDKSAHLEKLYLDVGPTLMVGDGINDPPALATATLGATMGSRGTDAALETAGVVFLNDDLSRLPLFLTIAKKTRRIIRQNISMAIGIKLLVFLLAMGGVAQLWMAVFADTGASLLVVMNGLRALRPQQ
ncbi:cation-translocating P-type ATPase [bacterium]|nr:cation-translocating P-type ATPase [bacterium]